LFQGARWVQDWIWLDGMQARPCEAKTGGAGG
jgi:hypothetical protein